MPGAEVTGPGGDSDPLWCILAPTRCMPSLWAAGLCVCVCVYVHARMCPRERLVWLDLFQYIYKGFCCPVLFPTI